MLYTVISATIAVSIIIIGLFYIVNPRMIMPGFGLPLPDNGSGTIWWLRLKGIRDMTSGLLVVASLTWGVPYETGVLLLISALIPAGDMLVILAARGSASKALGIHGITAAAVILTGASMLMTGIH